jgi:tetratricopeptide (TPR) repeat protein
MEDGRVEEAEQHFREVVELYPAYVGPGNAWLALAGIYRDRADEAKIAEVLEKYLEYADHGAAEARELAALRAKSGRTADATALLDRSLEVDPYDREARSLLAQWYADQGRTEEVIREREAVLALEPVDRAEAYYQLANALFDGDDIRRAKRATLQALEIAPGHREAQKLLLACVEREP